MSANCAPDCGTRPWSSSPSPSSNPPSSPSSSPANSLSDTFFFFAGGGADAAADVDARIRPVVDAFARADGFRYADAHNDIAARNTPQPDIALIAISPNIQPRHGHAIGRCERRRRYKTPQNFLYQRGFQHTHAEPALRFRYENQRHAQVHQPGVQLACQRIIAFGIDAHMLKLGMCFQKPAHGILQHALIFG